MSETVTTTTPTDVRRQARERLEKRRDFKTHAFIYVVVNAALTGIWAIATPDTFFWPVFVIFGWGIGLAGNAWDVYARRPITEEQIDREEQRLRRRGATAS